MLRSAASSFDKGGVDAADEALNIAARLRVLLHDGVGQAALKLAGYRDTMKFVTTIDYTPPPGPLMGFLNFVLDPLQRQGPPISYRAPLNAHLVGMSAGAQARRIRESPDFETWWTMPIIRDQSGPEFTRRDIVLTVANQDGGAHVDPTLDEAYMKLSRSIGYAMTISLDGGPQLGGGDPVPTVLRQIAWEFEASLVRFAPVLARD